jgi:hypothetical protein
MPPFHGELDLVLRVDIAPKEEGSHMEQHTSPFRMKCVPWFHQNTQKGEATAYLIRLASVLF